MPVATIGPETGTTGARIVQPGSGSERGAGIGRVGLTGREALRGTDTMARGMDNVVLEIGTSNDETRDNMLLLFARADAGQYATDLATAKSEAEDELKQTIVITKIQDLKDSSKTAAVQAKVKQIERTRDADRLIELLGREGYSVDRGDADEYLAIKETIRIASQSKQDFGPTEGARWMVEEWRDANLDRLNTELPSLLEKRRIASYDGDLAACSLYDGQVDSLLQNANAPILVWAAAMAERELENSGMGDEQTSALEQYRDLKTRVKSGERLTGGEKKTFDAAETYMGKTGTVINSVRVRARAGGADTLTAQTVGVQVQDVLNGYVATATDAELERDYYIFDYQALRGQTEMSADMTNGLVPRMGEEPGTTTVSAASARSAARVVSSTGSSVGRMVELAVGTEAGADFWAKMKLSPSDKVSVGGGKYMTAEEVIGEIARRANCSLEEAQTTFAAKFQRK